MATELPFPRTRHLALAVAAAAGIDPDVAARAEAAQAVVVPLAAVAPPPAPHHAQASTPEGPRPQPGTPPALAAPGLPPESLLPPRMVSLDLSRPRDAEEACLDEDGDRSGGGEPVVCPSSLSGRNHAAELSVQAAAAADGILLRGLSRWYELGPRAAGYCSSCEEALIEALRETYGDHVQRFPALSAKGGRDLPPRERPFAGLRELLRLREPLEAAKRSILRARDEARRSRGVELVVMAETGALHALSLALCKHVDGLAFPLPSVDPLEALFPLLAARAALGERTAVGIAPAHATPAQVVQLSALAAACDADLMLPEGASAPVRAALAGHRRYQGLVRERFRASVPLSDLTLLVSATGDHWSAGAHLRASASACAALAAAHLQLAVRIDQVPPGPHGQRILVVAGCEAMPEAQAAAVRRHVAGGGDLLLVGPCAVVDAEGRRGEPLFPNLKHGLDRQGEGRIWALAPQGPLPEPSQEGTLLVRAARELLGRGRQSLSLSGRGHLLARAYLDPERKLDVHLVNLDLREGGFGPAQGLTLHIAGQAAGGGRVGYWFAPERAGGRDGERISLNPSGFSVSTVLPAIGASALLAVPR